MRLSSWRGVFVASQYVFVADSPFLARLTAEETNSRAARPGREEASLIRDVSGVLQIGCEP